MALLSELNEGHIYFFEFEGNYILGEFVIDWGEDYTDEPMVKYLSELWSDDEDGLEYNTYVSTKSIKSLNIIKSFGHKYDLKKYTEDILQELKEELPEYFI
jgi:hypothetical protein